MAIFGVLAGFTYYVITVRNAQRVRELTLKAQEQSLETRQTQLFMQIYSEISSKDFQADFDEFLYNVDPPCDMAPIPPPLCRPGSAMIG